MDVNSWTCEIFIGQTATRQLALLRGGKLEGNRRCREKILECFCNLFSNVMSHLVCHTYSLKASHKTQPTFTVKHYTKYKYQGEKIIRDHLSNCLPQTAKSFFCMCVRQKLTCFFLSYKAMKETSIKEYLLYL